jgi:UDP-glucose:(heptosyl)LPS alpha-1,3-glucosyltransferase
MTDGKTARLKIAVVRPYFTQSKGGAERYAVELVRGLVALGHSVHVFAYRWDRPEEAGVAYHGVWMPRKPAWLRVLIFHWNLRRRLVHADYDAVLGMTPFWPQTVFWLGDGLYSVWTRVAWPNALVRRLMCLKRAVMTVNLWMERKILCGATNHLIANSRLVQRQAAQHYGVPAARLTVVYPVIDTKRFHPGVRSQWRAATRRQLGIGDQEVALLFISNNFQRKGLDLLIGALVALSGKAAAFRLIVAGAGRVAPFRRLARRLGVEQKIIFTGLVDRIERYYGAGDVFVLPTRYDPCAGVCLEAMACGLPVVTTARNGASDLIGDGAGGFILSSEKIAAQLADRLKLLADPRRAAAMGAVAADRVKTLTVENNVRQTASVLDRVAQERSARRSIQVIRPAPDLLINREFAALLESRGLASFAALMEAQAAKELPYNRLKRIYKFALEDGSGCQNFFLKRQRRRASFWERWRWSGGQRALGEGMREWQHIVAFQRRGLPVVTPVAAGERLLPGGLIESFVMTQSLEGFEPADRYVSAALAAPLDQARLKSKRRLIAAIARFSRGMHEQGFNHRDFYLCHIFVRDAADGSIELRIIDLQRVDYRAALRRRWLNKDLAALHYSSLCLPLSDRDRLRFFVAYGSGLASRRARRRQLRRILRKSRAIARHDAKLRGCDGRSVAGPSWAEPRH